MAEVTRSDHPTPGVTPGQGPASEVSAMPGVISGRGPVSVVSGGDTATLAGQLRAAGVPTGGDLLVHVSLSRLGVDKGLLLAGLREVAGPGATIMVPAQTAHNSITSPAYRRAVAGMDEREIRGYEAAMPGFSPGMPSSGCGGFAEYVRQLPGAVRSGHPQTSFAAVGPRAAELMAVHDLESHLGERSPLGALYRDGGHALLIGCDWSSCTALHLAECRVPRMPRKRYRCFVEHHGRRITRDFLGVDHDDSDFLALGKAFEATGGAWSGPLGCTTVTVLPVRAAVHFAVRWLTDNRKL
ncbi:aminoglycoside N(3)-acetyltransferase [Winogradskya humida]|uniref:Aminoglycoside N(3)-acetyltransferase n=1 Tax=Winogradskya humida TaxID=113566 RepID=A0ABQ3ZK05_9ACTN|nr:AAC(3) family N-acetyltransferase [Actinoplanes humidus]GIE18930.1 AAC(3) family N-acetyltransferase [Actinoplanes humidus]